MTRQNPPKALCAAVVLGALLIGSQADAVGTRRFVINTLSGFKDGDLKGVSVTSNGTVQAGWKLGALPITEAPSVWSSAVLNDGSVLLGTGNEGKIFKVVGGRATEWADIEAMAVSAMTLGWNGDVVVGTFPSGKLYRFSPTKAPGTKPTAFVTLPDTEDIWSLAYDAKAKVIYAATGPKGKLFRIDSRGKAEVYFDSEEPHLVSVAVSHDGSVYTGSNGKALLYKLTGPGRATVVYDFDTQDVKAIAIAPAKLGGAVYVVANKYSGSYTGLRPRGYYGSGPRPAGPSSTSTPRAGKGKLMRFAANGVAELMLDDKKTHFVTLVLDDKGQPFLGSGAEGRVYSVDKNHVVKLWADTEERQVGAISLSGKKRFIVSSDPLVFHEIKGRGGADAVWTSKVLDSALRAHYGMLKWRADGRLEFQTRSGNTKKPDKTWSAWSRAMTAAAKVTSPPARYLQIRARFSRDPNAVLYETKLAFVTDNARALLTEVKAGSSSSSSSGSSVPSSGGPLGKPSTKVSVSWKVDNPDKDKLRYRVLYRTEKGKKWFSMLEPDKELTSTSHSWDTAGLPEGWYRIRVDASDELANPPDKVTRHSLVSRSVLVDNTPPRLSKLQLRGLKLTGTATDGVGPIARIEFSRVGSKTWYPVFPNDGVFDQATESFSVDLTKLIPPGRQLVVVRAYDLAKNQIEQTVATAP